MRQKTNIKEKIEIQIRESKLTDTILSIFKSGLSFTKYSPLASLISEYIPNRRFLRLKKFAKDLANDLNDIDDKIDTEFITTDEFAFIFEQCFKAASENYQKEKLEAFKAIIINSAVNTDLDSTEREFFLNLTNSITVLHIRILKFLHKPKQYLANNNIPETLIVGGFGQFFPNVFPDIDLETIKMAFDDLHTYGLITSDKSIFHTMTVSGGFQLLGDRVSNNGKKYIEFISSNN